MATRNPTFESGSAGGYGAADSMITDPQYQLPARTRRFNAALVAPLAAVALGTAGAVTAYLLRRKQQENRSLRERIVKSVSSGYDHASELAGKASHKAADLVKHEGRDLAEAALSTSSHLAQRGGKLAAKTYDQARDKGQMLAEQGSKVAQKGLKVGQKTAQDGLHTAQKQFEIARPLLQGLALMAAIAYLERLNQNHELVKVNGQPLSGQSLAKLVSNGQPSARKSSGGEPSGETRQASESGSRSRTTAKKRTTSRKRTTKSE